MTDKTDDELLLREVALFVSDMGMASMESKLLALIARLDAPGPRLTVEDDPAPTLREIELNHIIDALIAGPSDAQIKYMADRFLGWKLPENFNPDAGISFKKTFNDHTAYPMKHEPSGTNLFDAEQALEMVRYMVAGLSDRLSAQPKETGKDWASIHTIPSCDDLMWFSRGNTFEGPRTQHGDEADYWDWWCYAVPPSLPAPEKAEGETP